jgi:hypothetical protein
VFVKKIAQNVAPPIFCHNTFHKKITPKLRTHNYEIKNNCPTKNSPQYAKIRPTKNRPTKNHPTKNRPQKIAQ